MTWKVDDTCTTSTLIAHRLIAYLESAHKTIDADVLNQTAWRMRQVITRDLMQPRESRAGRKSNTLYSGPCARKARYTFDGAAQEPLNARTLLKFLLGDLVELSVLAMANLAECHILDNNIDLHIVGTDGVSVPVHPDGRYVDGDGVEYNVEIKSCDSRTFDAWLANGGPDDTWGYRTQASVEIAAWQEYGFPIAQTIFLAVSTGSRQGSIAEFLVPYEPELVAAWHARRDAARLADVPAIPFAAESEMAFLRGKEQKPEYDTHGTAIPRINEKGAIYGWDVPTGRQIVPLACSYCIYRSTHCWPTADLEVSGGKPLWVVPAAQELARKEG